MLKVLCEYLFKVLKLNFFLKRIHVKSRRNYRIYHFNFVEQISCALRKITLIILIRKIIVGMVKF